MMNNSVIMLLVKEKAQELEKYEKSWQTQKLRRMCLKMLIPKQQIIRKCQPPSFITVPLWPSPFPQLYLHVAVPQFRSGIARDTAYNIAAQPAL